MTLYAIFTTQPELLVGPGLLVAAVCFGFIWRAVYVPPSEIHMPPVPLPDPHTTIGLCRSCWQVVTIRGVVFPVIASALKQA